MRYFAGDRTSRGRTRTGTGVTPQGILGLLRGLPRAIEDCHQTTRNTVFSGVFLHLYIVHGSPRVTCFHEGLMRDGRLGHFHRSIGQQFSGS
jgi:hypothetical protein